MTQSPRASYRYAVDADDTLVSVSDSWLRFARENEAPELACDAVLGRSLWSFVNGRETREIYELLFEQVRRAGSNLSLPIRCDSPDAMRFMRMELAPSGGGGVEIAVNVERVEPRSHLRLLERLSPRADYSFDTCSLCQRIFAFGAWLEPEDAIARLGWLEGASPPELSESVCEACARVCRDQLEAAPRA